MGSDRLNWWLTLVANLGVIGGLVFLGYETRQNTSQMRAEAAYSINEALETLNADKYHDPVLVDILLRGGQDLGSLTPVEREQFVAYQFVRVNLADYVLTLEREGIADVHIGYIEWTAQAFRNEPGLREWIASIKDTWVGSDELYALLTGSRP